MEILPQGDRDNIDIHSGSTRGKRGPARSPRTTSRWEAAHASTPASGLAADPERCPSMSSTGEWVPPLGDPLTYSENFQPVSTGRAPLNVRQSIRGYYGAKNQPRENRINKKEKGARGAQESKRRPRGRREIESWGEGVDFDLITALDSPSFFFSLTAHHRLVIPPSRKIISAAGAPWSPSPSRPIRHVSLSLPCFPAKASAHVFSYSRITEVSRFLFFCSRLSVRQRGGETPAEFARCSPPCTRMKEERREGRAPES